MAQSQPDDKTQPDDERQPHDETQPADQGPSRPPTTVLDAAMVRALVHDLRNPLASVIGYLDLVLEGGAGPLSESQRNFLGTAARNAEVLLGMLDAQRFANALGAEIVRSPTTS